MSKGKGNIGICCDFFGHGLLVPRQSFAFVSRGTFLAVDAEATSLLESLETSLAGVRTARKHLRLEIGKFSAIEEVSNNQRYKEEVYFGKCGRNRMEWGEGKGSLAFPQKYV